MASRILLIGLLFVYIFATGLAIPADTINYPNSEEIQDFSRQNQNEDLQKNLRLSFVQPNEDFIDKEALSYNLEEEETKNDAFNGKLSPISVTKSLPVESVPKSIILTSDGNGVGSYSVSVNNNGINKVVNIANPSVDVYDAITIGPNADSDVINTNDGKVLIVGSSIFSDTPGYLVVFEDQNCELRSYSQGTSSRQPLSARQCSQLRGQMEQARSIYQNVAQNTGYGQTLPQNYASGLSQTTYPFGQAVTSALSQVTTNPLSQVVTNPYTQTATTPFGLTATNPLIQTATNSFGQTVTTPFGQTITTPISLTGTNPLIQTVTTPFGQTITNPFSQTGTNPLIQTVTTPNGQTPIGQIVTQTNPSGQTYSNYIGQTLPSNFFDQAVPYNFNQANSAFGSNWPLAANNIPFNGYSFNPPFGHGGDFFGPGGDFFGPGPGPRHRPPFHGRRRRPRF